MDLMIADDGVDDDSDAVSDNNNYDATEGGHYSHTSELLHIQLRCSELSKLCHISYVGVKHFSTERWKSVYKM